MSRSYRRNPHVTDQNAGKPDHGERKRRASRKVRSADMESVSNGSAYRRVYNPWNICDWSWYDPRNPKARRK